MNVKQIETLHVSFFFFHFQLRFEASTTAVTLDDFFKENIVKNIAALLGIDSSRIKFMEVISASRKRRNTEGGKSVTLVVSFHNVPLW